jgi:hypothetical protein
MPEGSRASPDYTPRGRLSPPVISVQVGTGPASLEVIEGAEYSYSQEGSAQAEANLLTDTMVQSSQLPVCGNLARSRQGVR